MDLMSVAQLLGNFGEFFGAIAVIVTLIFLAFQIRQNTKALKVSAYSGFVERHIQMISFQAQYRDVLTEDADTEGISRADRRVHVARLSGTLRNGDALHYQWQQGLLDNRRWESVVDALIGVITDSALNRQIWLEYRQRYNEDFRREIDSRLGGD